MRTGDVLRLFRRRIAIRLSGFSRPPFTLIYLNRKRLLSFLFPDPLELSNSSPNWGFWFYPETPISDNIKKSEIDQQIHQSPLQTKACFLWPDRLLWDFLILSLLISAPLFFESPFVAFLTFSISCIFPYLIFFFFRIPSLCYLDNKLPRSIKNKINNTIHQQNNKPIFSASLLIILAIANVLIFSGQKLILNNCSIYTLPFFGLIPIAFITLLYKHLFPFKERWDQAYYLLDGSFKESLIRLALIEKYQRQEKEDEKTIWISRSFSRWLFYWCSPVWGTYLLLWLVVFLIANVQAVLPPGFDPTNLKNNLFMSSILWTVYSVVFIRKESTQFARWTALTRDDEKKIPPLLLGTIKSRSDVVEALTDEKIKLVSGIITGFSSLTFVSTIRFFIFT